MSTPAQVWTRFTKIRDGKELKLRIQELPKDKVEDMFDFLFKYFVPDEPLHKTSKVSQKTEALQEYKQVLTMMTSEVGYQIDVCCLDEDSGELQVVGVSIMVLEKKEQPCDDLETIKTMVQTDEIITLLNLSTLMHDTCNTFDKFNSDACYKGRCLAVHADYRNLGIGGELLKVRSLICKERGVPFTSAWMTVIGSQKAAAKLGWETIYELDYKHLGKLAGVQFEGGLVSCKLVVKKV